MRIIYEDDTERTEFETYYKGYRRDIVVEIDDYKYRIHATTMARLVQDYELESKEYGYFQVEPNIVIVEEVTKEIIEKTLLYQAERKYFDRLKYHGFDQAPWATDKGGIPNTD